MGKTKTLTKKQQQRIELNKVLDFNESELVKMQQKDWKDLDCNEINILENFIAVAIGTMRACPPAYVIVASNNVVVRARSVEAVNLLTKNDGSVVQENKTDSGVEPVKEVDAEHF